MRFLLGLIIGAAVTVGFAFVHDNGLRPPAAQAYVNWNAVDESWRDFSARIRSGWNHLTMSVDHRFKASQQRRGSDEV